VTAVTDINGGVYNPAGIDPVKLKDWVSRCGQLKVSPAGGRYRTRISCNWNAIF